MEKEFVAKFSVQPTPKMTANFTMQTGGGVKDHNKLENRDLPDQHPISAITDLQNTLDNKQDSLTTEQQSAVDSGITSTKVEDYDNHIANKNNPHEVTKEQVGLGNVDNTADEDKPISDATQDALDDLSDDISDEISNRQDADNDLQSQIDALVVSSDVFDVVGTYDELQAYDISKVPVNDIIKVLVDNTHDNAATYYRCIENGGIKSWSYIGAEGAYYTKAEADGRFVPLTRKVNNKALSSDISLTASDVGALPDNTIIPTKTSELQNDSGFLTSHQSIKTLKTDNTTAQSTSSSEAIAGTGTINLHKVSKTGSYNDLLNKPTIPTKVSDLQNDSGFTSNVGTVTSVRVQAGTGLSSSTSTEQTTTLNTTISIATGYKLPTTTEWNNLPSAPTVTTITDTTYSLSVAENTIYEFTNAVTSLTISSVVKSYLESFIYFTTGSSITFTDNSTLKWGGGSVPTTLEANTTYCIAIKNGLAEIDKFGRQ